MRYCLRQKFEANRHVTNQKAIDVLILKGRQEYQETMNGWKMIEQVYGLLLDSNEKRMQRARKGFLERFYEGKLWFASKSPLSRIMTTMIFRKRRRSCSSCSIWCRIELIEFSFSFLSKCLSRFRHSSILRHVPNPSAANPRTKDPHPSVRKRLVWGIACFTLCWIRMMGMQRYPIFPEIGPRQFRSYDAPVHWTC